MFRCAQDLGNRSALDNTAGIHHRDRSGDLGSDPQIVSEKDHAHAELTLQPTVTVPVEGGQARAVLSLIEALEDNDDVQAVHANFDIPEDVMAEVG